MPSPTAMPLLPPVEDLMDPSSAAPSGHHSTSGTLQRQGGDVFWNQLQVESEGPTSSSTSTEVHHGHTYPCSDECPAVPRQNKGPQFQACFIPSQTPSDRAIDSIESYHRQHSIRPIQPPATDQRKDFCAGSTPQELADIACDNVSSSPLTLPLNLQFLSETWIQHGVLPTKWRINDVASIEPHPFSFTGSSDIKRASHSGKVLALKFLRPKYLLTGTEERIMELFREACRWSLLHHPHILPFLGIFAGQPSLALVSHHQANGSLYEFLVEHADADRIQLLGGVASGLQYLHTLTVPIMHGDLRAMNVLVDSNGNPLIIDFDCASLVNERGHAINSPTDQLRGTPRHLPPEKMLPGLYPITLQADIWCFGMLCIEVFTNDRPFNHIANDGAIVVKVLAQQTYPLRPHGPFAAQLTDEIWKLMQRCWALDPSRRPTIDAVEAFFSHNRP